MYISKVIQNNTLLNENFLAGRLQLYQSEWYKITTDKDILIPFLCQPYQYAPTTNSYNTTDNALIENEIHNMLKEKIIVESDHVPGEFISPIFLRPKKDKHLKMENHFNAVGLMTKDCFMARIDLVHGYYCVPVAKHHQKYLKFEFNGKLYQYTVFPNGIACCPDILPKY
jgi:hypothetical protein